MCTLPQGVTNSVACIQSVMNQILRAYVFKKSILFLDDIPIKGCKKDAKDLILNTNRCKRFVNDYIKDVEKILKKFEEVNLTLSIDKYKFGINKIVVIDTYIGGIIENLILRRLMLLP